MFCYQCSKIIKDDSKFCQYCGAVQEVGKKGQLSKGTMVSIVFVAVVLVSIFYGLTNIHTCDWCDSTYLGSGYYDSWDPDEIMCEDCAKDYYRGMDYTRFKAQ